MRKEIAARYYEYDRAEMLPFVPCSARKILDIGCANGKFSMHVKQRQDSEIWGIELNSHAASVAATRLDKVIIGDVSQVLNQLPESYFDCLVCNDILEHLPDPENVLKDLKKNLLPEAVIVASIPNVRYLPVLYELLIKKDWKYRDTGVLDNTHLRFFTQKSIRRLFESSGYRINKITGIKVPAKLIESVIFFLVGLLTLGYYKDTRFIQYACIARKSHD